ncbi:MAG: alpha/beta hydrolase [Clostridia bacterium]|nr:alpha/beta hydrolase [Clostridia bacterium]
MKKLASILLCISILAGVFSLTAFAGRDYKPYDNSEYFTKGDYDIHYRVFPAKGERKGRIMMLHGFVCSTFSWRNMVEILTADGYECVAADLPNFGYSTRETPGIQVIEREELIISLMNGLAPDEEWILAGHSMGGGVAVNIAERIPLKALLLYCPCAQSEFPSAAEKIVKSAPMKGFMNAFFKYGTKITPLVKLIIYAATNDFAFAMDYETQGVTAPVQYDGFGAGMCEMMYNVIPTDLGSVSKITCPVLLCQAQKDIILNDAQKAEMNDAFPQAQKHTLSGAGHQMIENRADELCEITQTFLEG